MRINPKDENNNAIRAANSKHALFKVSCFAVAAASIIAIRLLASANSNFSQDDRSTKFPFFPRRIQEDNVEVAIEVAFMELYDALVFLFCVFVGGHVATLLTMPNLVGHIIVGFLLGPPLANFVPFPQAFVLFGDIGIILLLVEAGIDLDIAQLKLTGIRSVAIAHAGAFGALAVGAGIAFASQQVTWQGAVCLGAVFSPTSFGVASNALITGNMINTPVGQIIVAAAVIDDVIALVILSVVQQLVLGGDVPIIEYFIPVISSVAFLTIGGYIAIYPFPKFITNHVLTRIPTKYQESFAFLLLIVLIMAYMPLMSVCKTNYLTGAFLAGLSFNQIPSIHHSFIKNTKNTMAWLLRIFFSSSIGFQVPIKLYGDPMVIAWGFAFYIAVLAKLPLGLFVPRLKRPKGYPFSPFLRDCIITGVAMTCRGEFSFIIASFAVVSHLVSSSMYASVVWAVLLSSITSPFFLLAIIRYFNKLSKGFVETPVELLDGEKMPMYWVIQAKTTLIWGLRDVLSKAIDELGLAVIDYRSWNPSSLDAVVVTEIYVEDIANLISIPDASHTDQLATINEMDHLDATDAMIGDPDVNIIGHRREEIAVKLLKVVESMGDEHALIQVKPWLRAAVARVQQPDHISFRIGLQAEAAKELKNKEGKDTVEVYHTARNFDAASFLQPGAEEVNVVTTPAECTTMLAGFVRENDGDFLTARDIDVAAILAEDTITEIEPTLEERLGGYVRH